jgi:hypothetical protein
MAKGKKNRPQSKVTKSKDEEEKLKILAKADEVKGEQLMLTDEGEFISKKELKEFALGNIENPEKKYDVYYKGIQKLLLKHLPKGPKNKKARNYIYEEKNTYLTRGKRISDAGIRGADGRMGYISDAEEVLKIVMDWIISNGTMIDLFNKFRDINEKKGYGTPKF